MRDASLGQTHAILRRESDGQLARWWIAEDSPWVYAIPWAEVNSRYAVLLAVLALVPLGDQYLQPNQLVRRFDGGNGRIVAYDAGLATAGWTYPVRYCVPFNCRGLEWVRQHDPCLRHGAQGSVPASSMSVLP